MTRSGFGALAVVLFVCALAFSLVPGVRAQSGGAAPRSVWDGVFTADQAERGRGFYLAHCAQCHGGNLEGGEYSAMRGDRFWASWQGRTVAELLTHITENMPFSEDGSLKGTLGTSTYVDIVAHILRTNAFPAGEVALTTNSSAGVQIARRDGSSELPSGSFAYVVGCLAARGPDRNWRLERGSTPVRITAGRDEDPTAPLGDRAYTLMFVITSLDKFVGHRMSVRATLMGEGGAEGLNVGAIQSISPTCE